MEIKLVCVQSTELGVQFTHFTSAVSIIECVSDILKVGHGLAKDRRMPASVELLFHEHRGNLFVPRSYRFFFDMCPLEVSEYLAFELSHITIE